MPFPLKSTYGLIGYPLGHSLSPVMHNTAFQELGVDAEYVLFPMTKEELGPFCKDLKQEGSPIFGLNVTVPHKENILPFIDGVDAFAEKVGAVNTIVIDKDRRLLGLNTDGPGFLAHLLETGFQPAGKRIAILGAGGASRAIMTVFCLLQERPELVRLYDIDHEKATALVADLGARMDVSRIKVVSSIDDLNIELADLLVNATPIGMKPEDPCLISEELLHPHLVTYDLVYNPPETKLLKMTKAKGGQAVNGLKMLFYQGVLAFQHWAEIQLPENVKGKMWLELEKACYKK
ncbi:MAG: shikimate dehydrogenase [Candidatus Omnitrophica bacterium]|nr:shikimate dehydrogenase [Candidatus Omnitrophota bacterium]